jgi:hypothetical protein
MSENAFFSAQFWQIWFVLIGYGRIRPLKKSDPVTDPTFGKKDPAKKYNPSNPDFSHCGTASFLRGFGSGRICFFLISFLPDVDGSNH